LRAVLEYWSSWNQPLPALASDTPHASNNTHAAA
jgi:hypothetical protein